MPFQNNEWNWLIRCLLNCACWNINKKQLNSKSRFVFHCRCSPVAKISMQQLTLFLFELFLLTTSGGENIDKEYDGVSSYFSCRTGSYKVWKIALYSDLTTGFYAAMSRNLINFIVFCSEGSAAMETGAISFFANILLPENKFQRSQSCHPKTKQQHNQNSQNNQIVFAHLLRNPSNWLISSHCQKGLKVSGESSIGENKIKNLAIEDCFGIPHTSELSAKSSWERQIGKG